MGQPNSATQSREANFHRSLKPGEEERRSITRVQQVAMAAEGRKRKERK